MLTISIISPALLAWNVFFVCAEFLMFNKYNENCKRHWMCKMAKFYIPYKFIKFGQMLYLYNICIQCFMIVTEFSATDKYFYVEYSDDITLLLTRLLILNTYMRWGRIRYWNLLLLN